ncbi:MAG TPA: AbrB/MazE/SpoVT family DNA-binding domain-containing protein, partial [Chloroflexota bacterium]|nr:AbrB/MazE/SpoVT family DNA-binding domain-containing protein [Chloroflexota bacterium]
TMDAAGRLVVPKDIRRQAGLRPGMPLEIRWHDGRIEIEPARVSVTLVRKGRFVVAVPSDESSVLTTQEVEDMREAIACEHEAGL